MHEYGKNSYKGVDYTIYYDPDPTSPAEWDMCGRFHHWHARYTFGDDNSIRGLEDEEYEAWKEDNPIRVPVYMYDHGGITINTTGFHYPWDSGQFGWYVWDNPSWMDDDVTDEEKLKILKGEVETWDEYVTGDVYGYVLENEELDLDESCWGYYSESGLQNIETEIEEAIDYAYAEKHEQEVKLEEEEIAGVGHA